MTETIQARFLCFMAAVDDDLLEEAICPPAPTAQTRQDRFINAVGDDLLEEALAVPAHKVRVQWRRAVMAASIALAVLIGAVNLSPTVAAALESIPVVGELIRLIDYRTYVYRDDKGNSLTLPQPEAVGDDVEALNRSIEEETALLRQQFDALLAQGGYVGQDTVYEVLRSDERLFTVRFVTTLNLGGSGELARCLTLDRATGQVLTLSDLFAPGADYVTPISENLIQQMTERRDADEGDYFVPGGIWGEEECFHAIDPAQNFYIDEQNRLVIVFDEYQVAPGKVGMPEFTVPAGITAGLLAEHSPLRAQ